MSSIQKLIEMSATHDERTINITSDWDNMEYEQKLSDFFWYNLCPQPNS